MVKTLRPAFEMLKKIEGKNLIICFGTTGSGKSTMLNSLIYGADALELTNIKDEIVLKNGTKRESNRRVIELKDKTKGFKIGHSRITSQTFIPQFLDDPDPSKNLVWADVAGFTDSSGDLIEFINQFINKKLFLIAKEVKIIVPFTEGQSKEAKGGVVAQIVKLIQNIFCDYLGQETFSIQPILTQVMPNDDEFDFDIFKDTFDDTLKNELKNQFGAADDGDQDATTGTADTDENGDADEDADYKNS